MQPFESPHSMSLVHFFPERPDGSPLKIRRGLSALHPEDRGGIVTIGNFDGVHRGHQAILSDAVAEARAAGVPAVAVTFEPHPREVVRGIKVPRLTPFPVKAWLLARSGIDALVVLRFTQALAATDPATFMKATLADGLNAQGVRVGYDFAFGKGRAGGFQTLKEAGEQLGFWARQHEPFQLAGQTVSSTAVRLALEQADLHQVFTLLGRPHWTLARVVPGAGRGRTIGIPTANLSAHDNAILPPDGVYAVRVLTPDGMRDGVANIGTNPTFGGEARHAEVHLLEEPSVPLRGHRLIVAWIERLRGEVKFGGVEELVTQIRSDIEQGRAILAGHPAAQPEYSIP